MRGPDDNPNPSLGRIRVINGVDMVVIAISHEGQELAMYLGPDEVRELITKLSEVASEVETFHR